MQSSRWEVVNYLQQLCSNDVNIPIGSIVHTGMQNERGGYENDCILVRQAENSYFMVSPTSQQTRIYQWMSRHLPADHSVGLNDVTSKYTVINLVGPKATGLLSELSNSDINLSPFTYKVISLYRFLVNISAAIDRFITFIYINFIFLIECKCSLCF